MIPLQDVNPTYRRPYLTWGLILLNVLVFAYQFSLNQSGLQQFIYNNGIVPYEITHNLGLDDVGDVFFSMFIHGGFNHLFSNMLYLFIFGDNVEDRLGRPLYLLFYLTCGVVAAIAQVIISTGSQTPMVGASGAIAGVLGAYLIMYPGVRVRGLVILGYIGRMIEVPAWIVLGLWFVLQLFNGVLSLGVDTAVAFFAHVGGFVAGLALGGLFMLVFPQPPAHERREWVHKRYDRGRD